MKSAQKFYWGVATSAFQVEGALKEGGRGPSVWDGPFYGKIAHGDTGENACDFYHLYPHDIALLQNSGIDSFRLSISWTRLFPDGAGPMSEEGKNYYLSLVKSLLKAGITPWVTLFHWDYPEALEKQGGWLNPQSPYWFERYAAAVAELFDGLVDHYFTINEPQCFIGHGYYEGIKAPFEKRPLKDVFLMAHHVLMASGLAEKALRQHSKGIIYVGAANTYSPAYPDNPDDPRDVEAARADNWVCKKSFFSVSFWADPQYLGTYPADWAALQKEVGFTYDPKDLEVIHGHWDFFGINIYSGYRIKAALHGGEYVPCPDARLNSLRWEIHPKALYWGPKFLYERYHLPIIVSENGASFDDHLEQGQIHDPKRAGYIDEYVAMLQKAIADGIDIRGYFYWSFLDNFEWSEGYEPRFGLVYVDYATQKRYLKDSFYEYCRIAKSGGLCLAKEAV